MLEEFTPVDLYSAGRQLFCARSRDDETQIEDLCPNLDPRLHEAAVDLVLTNRAFYRDQWGAVKIPSAIAHLPLAEIFARHALNGPPPGFTVP